jgi:hypothetical protein
MPSSWPAMCWRTAWALCFLTAVVRSRLVGVVRLSACCRLVSQRSAQYPVVVAVLVQPGVEQRLGALRIGQVSGWLRSQSSIA